MSGTGRARRPSPSSTARVDGADHRWSRHRMPELRRCSRTATAVARWQISLARRRPSPAIRRLVAQEGVEPHRVGRRAAAARVLRRHAIGLRAEAGSSGRRGRRHPSARRRARRRPCRSVPASVSSQRPPVGEAPPRLARCAAWRTAWRRPCSRPPCMRCTTKVTVAEAAAAGTCRAGRRRRALRRRRLLGVGVARSSARERRAARTLAAPRPAVGCSSSRSAWAWTSGSSGVGLSE